MQIQLQGLRCKAEHLEAVANGGAFSIAADLSGVVEEKGNRVVVGAPAKGEAVSAGGAWNRAGGGFSPILKKHVLGVLGGVWLRRLRGPTLIEAQQEEVCRLRDLHLHVHLRTGRAANLETKVGRSCADARTLLLSSMEGALLYASE